MEDFNIWIPMQLDLVKSGDPKNPTKMRIKGIASTADVDTDNQSLEPSGFVLDRLLKSGYFNYDHRSKDDPSFIIGEPDVAKIVNGNLYVEGDLYDTALAKSVYEFGQVLEKSKSKRKLGMSIEGKVLEKDPLNPTRITKSLITGIAITPVPKNSNTSVDLVKGFTDELHKEYEYEFEKSIYGRDVILERFDEETGYLYTIHKDLSITKVGVDEIRKSIDTLLNAAKSGELDKESIKRFRESLCRLKEI